MANPTTASAISSGPPKECRLKFLCSHGGRILPRPADAHLKYVGGETRLISVPRDISFQELIRKLKLTHMIDGEIILKYQVFLEDLDTLISVKYDEDLRHMINDIDRCEAAGAPRLRAFIFPATPIMMEAHQIISPDTLEQRYIDAINGIMRVPPYSVKQHPMVTHAIISSNCSSLQSPNSEGMNNNMMLLGNNHHRSRVNNIHKVQSTPNLCSSLTQNSIHDTHQVSPMRGVGLGGWNEVPSRSADRSQALSPASSSPHHPGPTGARTKEWV